MLHMWPFWSAYFTACTCDEEGEVWKTEQDVLRGREGDVCVCVRVCETELKV